MKSGLTAAQVDLLRRLIEEDRKYRSLEAAGEHQHPDMRGIEVGSSFTGVKLSTAMALVDAGLAETIGVGRSTYIFLGKYKLYD